jgi:hypothetical protein
VARVRANGYGLKAERKEKYERYKKKEKGNKE